MLPCLNHICENHTLTLTKLAHKLDPSKLAGFLCLLVIFCIKYTSPTSNNLKQSHNSNDRSNIHIMKCLWSRVLRTKKKLGGNKCTMISWGFPKTNHCSRLVLSGFMACISHGFFLMPGWLVYMLPCSKYTIHAHPSNENIELAASQSYRMLCFKWRDSCKLSTLNDSKLGQVIVLYAIKILWHCLSIQ